MDTYGVEILRPVLLAAKFKKVILGLDIPSRKMILRKGIDFLNGGSEQETNCRAWAEMLYILTCEDVEVEMRKSQARNGEVWDDLLGLLDCPKFYSMVNFIVTQMA